MRPLFSISQVSTLSASFVDDVRAYAEAGVDAIGVWELKLAEGSLEEFRASRLGSATAVPLVPSVHPLPLLPGPDTVRARVDALLRSLEVLAPYAPAAILCFTGPGDRETAVRGVREVAREAERLGLRLAVEPFQLEGIESWSVLNTLGEAAAFVDEVGSDAVGIQFDVWHLWNTPDLLDEIPRHAHLIAGVHVSDWREPTRGWADRVLPGDGAADLPAILGVLEDVGWDRLLRSRDLLRQRRVRQRVSRLALGFRRRRARAAWSGRFRQHLVAKEGPGGSRGPERRNMRVGKGARWALVIVAAGALVFATAAAARTHSAAKKPIVIGWAHDSTGAMAPFDWTGARRGEARGEEGQQEGRQRPEGRDQDLQHAGQRLRRPRKACADKLIGRGREDHLHDV